MDFRVFKKDRKPGADGLFGWESEGLKARLAEAKAKPAPTKGVGTIMPHAGNAGMILRDAGVVTVLAGPQEEPAAERECGQPWLPPLPAGCLPWIQGPIPKGLALGTPGTYLTSTERRGKCFHFCWMWLDDYMEDESIVAYCLKDPS